MRGRHARTSQTGVLRAVVVVAVAAMTFTGVAADTGVATASSARSAVGGAVRAYSAPTRVLKPGALRVPQNSTLVLLAAAEGPSNARQRVVSVAGCGVRWHLERRANGSGGTSEIWSADGRRGTTCAPTATLANGGFRGLAALYAFPSSAVVTSAGASGRTGAAGVALRASRGSVVLGVGTDGGTAGPRTLARGQVQLSELQSVSGKTLWVQRTSAHATGRVRIGTVAPRTGRWNFSAVEIRRTDGRPSPSPRPDAATTAPTTSPTTPSTTSTSPPSTTPSATVTTSPRPTSSATASASASPSPSRTARPSQSASPTTEPRPRSSATPSASPSTAAPTPRPTATTTAPATWPGPSNTGVPAGVTLKSSGSVVARTKNQVIDGLDITGTLTISASGVTVTNTRIHGDGSGNGIEVRNGSVTVTDSEIYGFENGIQGGDWTLKRVDIHSMTGDGVKLGSDCLLQDSWIHDLTPGPGAHADGGQMQDGVRNLRVLHNTIDLSMVKGANAALFISPDLGPSTAGPVTIDGNFLDGGGYALFNMDGDYGKYYVDNISITNNRFGRGSTYGPIIANAPALFAGNVWADTGAPITVRQ